MDDQIDIKHGLHHTQGFLEHGGKQGNNFTQLLPHVSEQSTGT